MTQQETHGHVEVKVCSPLQSPLGRQGPILCRNFLIARAVLGESAALALGGAGAPWAAGPLLRSRSVVLDCAGKYGPSPPRTAHRGGVGVKGLEVALGLD